MRKFFALDLDRTLCDTAEVVRSFERFIASKDHTLAAAMRHDQVRVEQTGGSHDVYKSLYSHGGSQAAALTRQFVASGADPDRFLLAGARELLEAIAVAGYTRGIVTYGGEQWQRVKLALTGLNDEHALIVGTPGIKGALVSSWYDETAKVYRLPVTLGGGEFDSVVLVDDKPSELQGLDQRGEARGYLVTAGARMKYQPDMGGVPSGVTVVSSLFDVVADQRL